MFRHGKGHIVHNRYNGRRKPTVTRTVRPDGSVCRFSCNWHAAIREERHLGLVRKQGILAADHAALMRDEIDRFALSDEPVTGALLCCNLVEADGVAFDRQDNGRIGWASFGEECDCEPHKGIAADERLPQLWKRPRREDYLRASRLLC